ncbi:FGGY family carbohydrate kinase [Paenibacillus lautus]|uniref:FGGY-family carbohydrate kinase n=1 Tax=Paenibacillus lautus TaxID=1401 RepID=UPI003D2A62AD
MTNILSIDLGTTNIKVSVYDKHLTPLTTLSETVHYNRNGDRVEFDPDHYFTCIQGMIRKAAAIGKTSNNEDVVQIVLTGQAESLILLDQNKRPVHPAISWLDMRSRKECEELSSVFDSELCYRITGQPELIPTWPITKMLWMKRNKPDIFHQTAHYLLLKDYIIYRLCGRMAGDYSIYSFSHYFNITEKCYWEDILHYCGVKIEQLPEVLPSCSIAGTLMPEWMDAEIGLTCETKINVGTLDHFAGMIGTGNIKEGVISESAGTVLSIATLVNAPLFSEGRIPLNCGPFPDTYVLLPVCESGGFSLEWYKNHFLEDLSFSDINETLIRRSYRIPPVFLPYLTGVNAPDFNENASGVFFGIHASHDKYDFALAIMQGVACLLKKNLDYMRDSGVKINKIISTGGGAKSPLWTQLKSDITKQVIELPANEEAACYGAAIIGAVSEGFFPTFKEAVDQCVAIVKRYEPAERTEYDQTYTVFTALYDSLKNVYALNANERMREF